MIHYCSDIDAGRIIEDKNGFSSIYAHKPDALIFVPSVTPISKRTKRRALICLTTFQNSFKHKAHWPYENDIEID